MELPDGTAYISFRGTDDTIVGWKEDFNLSNGIVPSHRKALEYLEFNGTYMQSMIRLGGHSKGGNLAMYTAMQCDDALQEKNRFPFMTTTARVSRKRFSVQRK